MFSRKKKTQHVLRFSFACYENSAGMASATIMIMMSTETMPQTIPTFFLCFFENIINWLLISGLGTTIRMHAQDTTAHGL